MDACADSPYLSSEKVWRKDSKRQECDADGRFSHPLKKGGARSQGL